jgi:hypothetical protein
MTYAVGMISTQTTPELQLSGTHDARMHRLGKLGSVFGLSRNVDNY